MTRKTVEFFLRIQGKETTAKRSFSEIIFSSEGTSLKFLKMLIGGCKRAW
jgi:hypothetical protein